jgi:hypothetical protein
VCEKMRALRHGAIDALMVSLIERVLSKYGSSATATESKEVLKVEVTQSDSAPSHSDDKGEKSDAA